MCRRHDAHGTEYEGRATATSDRDISARCTLDGYAWQMVFAYFDYHWTLDTSAPVADELAQAGDAIEADDDGD